MAKNYILMKKLTLYNGTKNNELESEKNYGTV